MPRLTNRFVVSLTVLALASALASCGGSSSKSKNTSSASPPSTSGASTSGSSTSGASTSGASTSGASTSGSSAAGANLPLDSPSFRTALTTGHNAVSAKDAECVILGAKAQGIKTVGDAQAQSAKFKSIAETCGIAKGLSQISTSGSSSSTTG